MKKFIATLALCALANLANSQNEFVPKATNNVDPKTIEGVTLKHGHTTITVLSNAVILKIENNTNLKGQSVTAPSFLQKIGPFEIHKANSASVASRSVLPSGQSLPAFAQESPESGFLGTAYVHDIKTLGLISKEISVKFKSVEVPAQYKNLSIKELVPKSGLYVITTSDIYDWVKLVSRLQADTQQVSLVEPQILTHFYTPR
jgi:hypothetical protein